MLPMARKVSEILFFKDIVEERVPIVYLLETKEINATS